MTFSDLMLKAKSNAADKKRRDERQSVVMEKKEPAAEPAAGEVKNHSTSIAIISRVARERGCVDINVCCKNGLNATIFSLLLTGEEGREERGEERGEEGRKEGREKGRRFTKGRTIEARSCLLAQSLSL